MTTRRSSTHHSGKAELGLLAALLLFACVAAGAVWTVIRNYRPTHAETAGIANDTKRPASSPPGDQPARPADVARRASVTIVADPKTQAAITQLRQITPDDGKPRKAAKPPEKKAAPAPVAQLAVDGQVVDGDSAEVRAAVRLLKQYRELKSWKNKIPLVHQPGQAQPLMEEFYGSQGLADPALAGLISASNMRIGTRNVLTLTYSSGDRLNMVVGFSGKTMGAFRASRCVEPTVFRVLALPDDYYNFEFTDAHKLLSLRLYNPSGDDYLHGYCARDSAEGKKLVEILGGRSRTRPAMAAANGLRAQLSGHFPITVQLAFPEKAQSDRCVRIEKFMAPWWLALEAEKQATAALEAASPSVSTTQ